MAARTLSSIALGSGAPTSSRLFWTSADAKCLRKALMFLPFSASLFLLQTIS